MPGRSRTETPAETDRRGAAVASDGGDGLVAGPDRMRVGNAASGARSTGNATEGTQRGPSRGSLLFSTGTLPRGPSLAGFGREHGRIGTHGRGHERKAASVSPRRTAATNRQASPPCLFAATALTRRPGAHT